MSFETFNFDLSPSSTICAPHFVGHCRVVNQNRRASNDNNVFEMNIIVITFIFFFSHLHFTLISNNFYKMQSQLTSIIFFILLYTAIKTLKTIILSIETWRFNTSIIILLVCNTSLVLYLLDKKK